MAHNRGHKNFAAVFLLNLFLGWALVGWVGALVWAVLADQGTEPAYRRKRFSAASGPTPFDEPTPEPVPAAAAAPSALLAYTCPFCAYPVHVPLAVVGYAVTCGTCRRPFTATPPVC